MPGIKKYKHKHYRVTAQLPLPYPQLLANYCQEIANCPIAVGAQKIITEKLDSLVKDGILKPELSDRAARDILHDYLAAIAEGKEGAYAKEKLKGVVSEELFEALEERFKTSS